MGNKLIIATAGAGKSTQIVKDALFSESNSLLLTYTRENHKELISKIHKLSKKYDKSSSHIEVQTWISFLLYNFIRPYKNVFENLENFKINGLDNYVEGKSALKYTGKRGPVYYGEKDDFLKHYFNKNGEVYKDKVSKLAIKIHEKSKKENYVFERLSNIYSHIYIDEVQDLAGYDLDVIKYLFKSNIDTTLVGDPRQVTYLTHNPGKYKEYKNGKIKDYLENKVKKVDYSIDEMNISHRNSQDICDLSSLLYKELPKSKKCSCLDCNADLTERDGIFFVEVSKVNKYLKEFNPVQLRDSKVKLVNDNYRVMNFGESKGATFDRVIIYPTEGMLDWLKNSSTKLKPRTLSRLYVAITRARLSVAFVVDDGISIDCIKKYD